MIAKRFLGCIALVSVGAVGLIVAPAGATGSVTAGDTVSRQVGHAFASCTAGLGSTDALQQGIYFPAPGVGAVVGQAFYISNLGGVMRDRLKTGSTPAQIIDDMRRVNGLSPYTSADIDTTSNLYDGLTIGSRQYALSSLTAPGATFSGATHNAVGTVLPEYSEATTGTPGTDRYVGAAAGNTLTSSDFAGTMAGALQAPKDIVAALAELGVTVAPADVAAMHKGDLAERLFLSLEAGFGRPGQGDFRCVYGNAIAPPPAGTPLPANSRSSSMTWLRVDNANGTVAMNLRFRSLNNKDAVKVLGQMYYDCRMGRISCTSNTEDTTPPITHQVFNYSFTSDASNALGHGQALTYDNVSSTLTPSYDGRNLAVSVKKGTDSWVIEMTPPRGVDFASGISFPTEGGSRNNVGTLNLTRSGIACSRPFGHLNISNVAFSGSTLTALSATFDATCQGSSGVLNGRIDFTA